MERRARRGDAHNRGAADELAHGDTPEVVAQRDENRPSLLLIGLGVAVLAATIWFLYEIRLARARRRRRKRAVLIPEPMTVIAPAAAIGAPRSQVAVAQVAVSDEHITR